VDLLGQLNPFRSLFRLENKSGRLLQEVIADLLETSHLGHVGGLPVLGIKLTGGRVEFNLQFIELLLVVILVGLAAVIEPGGDVVGLLARVGAHVVDVPELLLS